MARDGGKFINDEVREEICNALDRCEAELQGLDHIWDEAERISTAHAMLCGELIIVMESIKRMRRTAGRIQDYIPDALPLLPRSPDAN